MKCDLENVRYYMKKMKVCVKILLFRIVSRMYMSNIGGHERKSSIIKSARPNKAGGHEGVPKRFERATKINNIMMLKTKRRKNLTLGGTVDHFENQFHGPEINRPKKSLGYKHW